MAGKREKEKKRLWIWPLTIVFAAILVAVMPSTPDSPQMHEVMPPVVEPSVNHSAAEEVISPEELEEPELPEEPEPAGIEEPITEV